MTQLTEHFALEELTASQTALERGIDNTPAPDIIANLTVTAQGLEQVRALLGNNPIHISSGYRCSALNAAVRGVPDSAHLTGFAADIECPDFGTPTQIVEAIAASSIPFDQAITEGTWAHVSFAPTLRRNTLTAHFDGEGHATYTEGVA